MYIFNIAWQLHLDIQPLLSSPARKTHVFQVYSVQVATTWTYIVIESSICFPL